MHAKDLLDSTYALRGQVGCIQHNQPVTQLVYNVLTLFLHRVRSRCIEIVFKHPKIVHRQLLIGWKEQRRGGISLQLWVG